MKKTALFPALLTVCSVISAFIYRSPFTYFNLFLSAVLLCIVCFSHNNDVVNRTKISALRFLLLELLALVLLPFGVNVYEPSVVWSMYSLFVAIELLVTPRIDKKR